MGHSAVDLARFRQTLARLQRDRTFFLSIHAQVGLYPRYLGALEWPSRDGMAEITVAHAPGALAAQIAFAYFLAIPEEERPLRFHIPEPEALEACIKEWELRNDNDQVEKNPQLMWEIARTIMIEQEPRMVREIERTVRNSELESKDQSLVLFSLGLFFLLAERSRSSAKHWVETVIRTTRTPADATRHS